MDDKQLTALAREFSKEHDDSTIAYHAAKDVINFLLRRCCLVEKRKLEELEIARRAKEHGAVWLNQWEAESLFPEIAKEVETKKPSHENSWCENDL